MSGILIVEDRDMVSRAISDMLMLNGYVDIWAAYDGRSALEEFKKRSPRLVLLDLMLPDKEGLELAKEMIDIDHDIKIVAVTAVNRDGLKEKCIGSGCVDLVQKPFRMAELMNSIEKHMGSD